MVEITNINGIRAFYKFYMKNIRYEQFDYVLHVLHNNAFSRCLECTRTGNIAFVQILSFVNIV